MGKLGLRAESAVPRVEDAGHRLGAPRQERRVDGAGRRFVERLFERPGQGQGLSRDSVALVAVDVEHLGEHRAETRPAVLPVWREVGAAVEDLPVGREERR